MKPRRSLTQMAQGGDARTEVAGRRADVCPYCGCALFVTGTRQGEAVTFRYVDCRNTACGKKFFSKQPPATLIREVGVEDGLTSTTGHARLTLRREAG